MDERRIKFPNIEDHRRLFREAEEILSLKENPFHGKDLHFGFPSGVPCRRWLIHRPSLFGHHADWLPNYYKMTALLLGKDGSGLRRGALAVLVGLRPNRRFRGQKQRRLAPVANCAARS